MRARFRRAAGRLQLEAVELGGGGRHLERRHVEAIAMLQVAQTGALELEAVRGARRRHAAGQVDQQDSLVADDFPPPVLDHGRGLGADANPARDAELVHRDQHLGEAPRTEDVLIDEPSVRHQPETSEELRGRHPPAGERLQRVDPGGQPRRPRDAADDGAAFRVQVDDGARQRRLRAVGPKERPGETLRRPADEEDPCRVPHLLDQRRILARPPGVDTEFGGVDRDGKELGERPVALQRPPGELAVELRPVAGRRDDHQLGSVLDDAVPDIALVERQHVADQDDGPRGSLRDTRPRPSEAETRNDQEQHRPRLLPRARGARAGTGGDARHRAHSPRPVMRAYSRGRTVGRASGRENTA